MAASLAIQELKRIVKAGGIASVFIDDRDNRLEIIAKEIAF